MSSTQLDRCAVQVEARRPNDPTSLGRFLDRVVIDLVQNGEPPSAALHIAGRVTRHTNWHGYRTGRSRVASMAATYLRWLSPSEGWTFDGTLAIGERAGIAWRSDDGRLVVDVLDVANPPLADVTELWPSDGSGPDAVRLLRMTAPGSSVVFTSPTRSTRLANSIYSFEGHR